MKNIRVSIASEVLCQLYNPIELAKGKRILSKKLYQAVLIDVHKNSVYPYEVVYTEPDTFMPRTYFLKRSEIKQVLTSGILPTNRR